MEAVKIETNEARAGLIDAIVEGEWDMFRSVNNVGGPAECQSQQGTFEIMRRAQFKTWGEKTLGCYLEDVKRAQIQGRNLMTEKYARMMAVTHPDEFAKIASMLPPVDAQVVELGVRIAAYHENWDREAAEKYPFIRANGRPFDGQSTADQTSADTYMRAELLTYSPDTLLYLLKDVETAATERRNLVIEQLEATMKQYGWSSIDEAEAYLSKKAATV
ncbi:MAG: DUF4125 family protein [Actinomycetaceae bacterium]|nr:DUF4125 family protein [Actinomycetaceae bacterium]